MAIKKLDRAGLDAWVDGIISDQTVYGVVARQKKFVFDNLKRASSLRLDYDLTMLPPKKYFQPQREVLSTFNVKTVEFQSVIDEKRRLPHVGRCTGRARGTKRVFPFQAG